MHYYVDVLKKYAVFSGRASRAEFWMFVLINAIISTIFSVLSYMVNPDASYFDIFRIVHLLYSLAVLLPSLGVAVRRLHDIGKSGWWILIGIIPIIGAIVLIIFYIMDSEAGTNKYGPNPKEGMQTPSAAPAAPAMPTASMSSEAPAAPASSDTPAPMQ